MSARTLRVFPNWRHNTTTRSVYPSNEPDVDRVRTIDVDGQNGFIVRMGDLLDFYHNRLDFEEYRSRWEFFEP